MQEYNISRVCSTAVDSKGVSSRVYINVWCRNDLVQVVLFASLWLKFVLHYWSGHSSPRPRIRSKQMSGKPEISGPHTDISLKDLGSGEGVPTHL